MHLQRPFELCVSKAFLIPFILTLRLISNTQSLDQIPKRHIGLQVQQKTVAACFRDDTNVHPRMES